MELRAVARSRRIEAAGTSLGTVVDLTVDDELHTPGIGVDRIVDVDRRLDPAARIHIGPGREVLADEAVHEARLSDDPGGAMGRTALVVPASLERHALDEIDLRVHLERRAVLRTRRIETVRAQPGVAIVRLPVDQELDAPSVRVDVVDDVERREPVVTGLGVGPEGIGVLGQVVHGGPRVVGGDRQDDSGNS